MVLFAATESHPIPSHSTPSHRYFLLSTVLFLLLFSSFHCSLPSTVLFLLLSSSFYCSLPSTVLYLLLFSFWYCSLNLFLSNIHSITCVNPRFEALRLSNARTSSPSLSLPSSRLKVSRMGWQKSELEIFFDQPLSQEVDSTTFSPFSHNGYFYGDKPVVPVSTSIRVLRFLLMSLS